ncbi:VanZ family protein [Umezawaea endophytica]|uniref:VanZ family protein n=1 Tax=Umezawaea endophytica TaxID=1654476 RepID=A0A9X3AGX7_9PSEU|nr:VanZ family protein [Umezawaea endophytica]MCS7478860.1 VanZ family protein [Umezawaea endophytica]
MHLYSRDAYLAEVILNQPLVVLALVLGCSTAGLVALAVAKWRGWRKLPAVLAGCGLAMALAVTLARPELVRYSLFDPIYFPCVLNDFSLADSLARLNFLMLTPFAFFGTLATRRPVPVLLASAAVSGFVELFQTVTSVGSCEAQDFYNNVVGAACAVALAWLVNRVLLDRGPAPVAERESSTG